MKKPLKKILFTCGLSVIILNHKKCVKKSIEQVPWALEYVPVHFKTKEMCEKVVEAHLSLLKYVPDNLKTQGMYKKAVEQASWLLKYVPNYFRVGLVCS